MTPNEPPTPNDDSGQLAEPDALRRLEERLDRASDAAERLISEAARAAAAARARAGAPAESPTGGSDEKAQPDTGRPDDPEAGDRGEDEPSRAQGQPGQPPPAAGKPPPAAGKPPPAGWQLPRTDATDAARDSEIELLANVLQSLRDLIPPELQERLSTALRELLLALRALIDWYIERMERQRAQPPEVEDIPIL